MSAATAANEKTIPQKQTSRLVRTTPIPDEFLNWYLSVCSGSELKVALYLYRRTAGFGKPSDEVSHDQICNGIRAKDGRTIDTGTGLDKKTAKKAIDGVVEKKIFRREPGRGPHADRYTQLPLPVLLPSVDSPDARRRRDTGNLKKRWKNSTASQVEALENTPAKPLENFQYQALEDFQTQQTGRNTVLQQTANHEPFSAGVQSAFYESSYVLKKRITDDESQKTAIRPSGRREDGYDFVNETQKTYTSADRPAATDALSPAVGREKPFAGTPTPEVFPDLVPFAYETHLAALRAKLAAYFGEDPRADFERKCFWTARGASVADICQLLDRKWALKKFRPGGRCGPSDWNWFLTVIRNEFSPIERGRLPEAPAADLPPRAEVVARGIEAIEISTAEDSLVSSYRCKCGAEIREYTTRIEGECMCRQSRRAPPGKETATAGLSSLARAAGATGT